MVDAEDNRCLEEEVGCIPTETGVEYVEIILKKISDLLYRFHRRKMKNVLGFFVIGRHIA